MSEFDFVFIALAVLVLVAIWQAYVVFQLKEDLVGLAERVFETQNRVIKMQEKERAERRRALYTPKPPAMSTSRSNLVYHRNSSDNDGYLGAAALGAVAGYGAASLFDDSDCSLSSGSYDCGSDFGDSCGDV